MIKEATRINKKLFFDEGRELPICVNEGCDRSVGVRDWRILSFRNVCNDCSRRMRKKLEPRDGVIFYKKNYCENRDGRLGFDCPVHSDFDFPTYTLQGDHIDGNHLNNVPENIQTLCSICHAIKGYKNGDFSSKVF